MQCKVLFAFGNRQIKDEKEYRMGKKYMEAARNTMKYMAEQYFGIAGAHTPVNLEIVYKTTKNNPDHTNYADQYYLKDIEDNTRQLALDKYDYAVFLIDEHEHELGQEDPMIVTLITIFNLLKIPYDLLSYNSIVQDVQAANPNWRQIERGEING